MSEAVDYRSTLVSLPSLMRQKRPPTALQQKMTLVCTKSARMIRSAKSSRSVVHLRSVDYNISPLFANDPALRIFCTQSDLHCVPGCSPDRWGHVPQCILARNDLCTHGHKWSNIASASRTDNNLHSANTFTTSNEIFKSQDRVAQQHCCNDDRRSQWENGDFDPCRSESPENFISKIG